jgi:hypothetical protein
MDDEVDELLCDTASQMDSGQMDSQLWAVSDEQIENHQVLTIPAESGMRMPEAELRPRFPQQYPVIVRATDDSLAALRLDDGVAIELAIRRHRHHRSDLALLADAQGRSVP